MIDQIKVNARTLQGGCGIYEVDHPDCYVKLFITDGGRVMPINHRAITEEDLMTVFQWGCKERWQPSEDIEMEDVIGPNVYTKED